jgi:hypothetical protein
MKLTTMAERIEMKVWMAPRVFLRCILGVTQPFLERFCSAEKPHIVMVASHALASLICPFSTFGPLLVLSMHQTRAQKMREQITRLLSPRLVQRKH